jgi:colicin import membrane protein
MSLKKLLLCVALFAGGVPVWAQTSAVAGNINPDAERARLTKERAEIDARAKAEQTACYQRFAVEDCLQESRRKRRTAEDSIKRQEADLNDMERKRRAADQLERLDKAPPRAVDDPAAQERARQSQQGREQRAADHAASRADAAAKAEDNRRALEDKQRAHAEQQAKAARLKADAPTERARFERKQEQAAKHRADRERQNAERTKPRSAPLPTPP